YSPDALVKKISCGSSIRRNVYMICEGRILEKFEKKKYNC
ncbi:hypothetical protein HMPREF0491_03029, partial [Lachnospiraceae oral taxon 107 str. F0167]